MELAVVGFYKSKLFCYALGNILQINNNYIERERRRSAKFVLAVYAVMALVFSLIALTIIHAGSALDLTDQTADFLARGFTVIAAANLLIHEIWRRTFKHRL